MNILLLLTAASSIATLGLMAYAVVYSILLRRENRREKALMAVRRCNEEGGIGHG